MKYRKLRITWSVAWIVAAALLTVLWVRSYWRSDYVRCVFSSTRGIQLTIFDGFATLDAGGYYSGGKRLEFNLNRPADEAPVLWHLRLGYFAEDVCLPIWLLAAAAALLGLAPRLSLTHFSLRGLLIITTLIAVGLGLLIYAARK
ncbi:MAG TPA: hypothetical protein VH107_05275 [Lacipirellulaceae bacterium]|jgi:hypothetical protein|nr:hypothetical protein [Lacipirellulaceae bacterium]